MSLLYHIPAMLRIAIVFSVVLIVIRNRMSLGNAFLLGALLLSLFFGLEPKQFLRSMIASMLNSKTLSLAVVVMFILILSNSMEQTGQMQRLLDRFKGLLSSPKLNMIVFPALIGLLPMPGGAVFSAPMVKELGVRSGLSSDQLSYINYWYRHIWEYCWPLYPGVLLATLIADLNLVIFVLSLFPITIVAVFAGHLSIKGIDRSNKRKNIRNRPPLELFIKEMVPILIVIIPGLGMGGIMSKIFPSMLIAKETGLTLSLCAAIWWNWHENGLSRAQIWKIITSPQLLKIGYMVVSILIFKGVLGDSNAVQAISDEFMRLHVPLVLITVALPFLVGISTGIVIAFVGSALPILVPLIHSLGETPFMLPYVMLALVSGLSGVLLSPLHLCLLLSNEYFGTPLRHIYRHLWLPCMCLLLSSMIYFWILYGLPGWM